MNPALGEFALIDRYFTRAPRRAALGVGDDCALLDVPAGMRLAVSTDMLVEGRHFLPDVDPAALGHKALAVNLSDLAAMGAEPLAFVLALALPAPRADWLEAFSAGMFELAQRHAIDLVGGDTTAGPLNLCLTVFGLLPRGTGLLRSNARAGDRLWVSGTPGDARLGLGAMRGEWALPPGAREAAIERLLRPTPRVELGLELRAVAHAAIDVSDGLLGDLRHVLAASGVGAEVDVDAIPAGAALAAQPQALRRACQLAGGDDYELLFTAPPGRDAAVRAAAAAAGVAVAPIGRIRAAPGVSLRDAAGQELPDEFPGFDHFRTS